MTQPAADATVSSIANLESQLATWAAAGPTSPKIVDMADGSYGVMSLSGYTFSSTVTIRSQDYDSQGANFTQIVLTSCTNINLQFLNVQVSGYSGDSTIKILGCTNCGIEYSNVAADYNYTTSYGQNVNVAYYGINLGYGAGSTYCYAKHCAIQNGFRKGIILGGTYHTVEGCVMHRISGDDFYVAGADHCTILNNWGARQKYGRYDGPGDPDNEHCDFIQVQAGQTDYLYARGNITMLADYGDPLTYQGVLVDRTMTYSTFTQNIIINDAVQGIWIYSSGDTGFHHNTIQYNTMLFVTDRASWPFYFNYVINEAGTGNVTDHNVNTCPNGGSAIGTGSIGIEVGTSTSNRDYSDQEIYYGGPITQSPAIDFIDIAPVEGQATHWDHASPTGAATRFKEVLVDGLHPGNQPGPVAAVWRTQYDPSSRIGGTPPPVEGGTGRPFVLGGGILLGANGLPIIG